jgi:hypothetical protein
MRVLIVALVAGLATLAGAPASASDQAPRSHLVRTHWDSWAPRPHGHAIRIWWGTNSAYKLEHVRVRERRRRVVITVIERVPNGPTTMAGEYRNKLLHLRRPVWGRKVIDGATGRKRPLAPGPGGP